MHLLTKKNYQITVYDEYNYIECWNDELVGPIDIYFRNDIKRK